MFEVVKSDLSEFVMRSGCLRMFCQSLRCV